VLSARRQLCTACREVIDPPIGQSTWIATLGALDSRKDVNNQSRNAKLFNTSVPSGGMSRSLYENGAPTVTGVERDIVDAVSTDVPWDVVERFAGWSASPAPTTNSEAAAYSRTASEGFGVDHEVFTPELYQYAPRRRYRDRGRLGVRDRQNGRVLQRRPSNRRTRLRRERIGDGLDRGDALLSPSTASSRTSAGRW